MTEDTQTAIIAEVEATPAPPPETPEPIAAEAETEEGKAEPKKPKGVGKRLSELTWQARQAERERDFWREQAMRNQYSAREPQYTEPEPSISEAPSSDIVEQVKASLRAEMEMQKIQEKRNALVEKAETEGAYAFFNDPTLPVTKEIAEVVLESDSSLALASYLGEHTAELRKIAALPPHKQGLAIARLERELATPRSRPVSAAPAPGPTVSGRAAVRTPEAMSTDEWMRWRSQQVKR